MEFIYRRDICNKRHKYKKDIYIKKQTYKKTYTKRELIYKKICKKRYTYKITYIVNMIGLIYKRKIYMEGHIKKIDT